MSRKFGIDISRWQGAGFNIANAKKNDGVEFVIIKCGGADAGYYKDSQFENFYNQCEAASVPKGCYYFSRATTMDEAKREVKHWLSIMKGHKFDYPVFLDVENKNQLAIGKTKLTEIVYYICKQIEKAGYWVGVYSSLSYFKTHLDHNKLCKFTLWVACWSKAQPSLPTQALQIWQFGGETNIIRTNKINNVTCDQDYSFVDFPTIIKNKGLNGYGKGTTVKKKTNAELAQEVLDGKWGNNPDRKKLLTEAGYNYSAIQTIVNKLVKERK